MSLQLTIDSTWAGGYSAKLSIQNTSNVDIFKYKILLKNNIKITWASSLKPNGTEWVPAEWVPALRKGETFVEPFGGEGNPPTIADFEFIQLDPPLIPIDPNVRGTIPDRFFAPYVDILHYPKVDLVSIAKQTGHYFYTLAFITSKGSEPGWGGVIDLEDRYFLDQIYELRKLGGDVIVSFGGANGIELALSNTDLNTLVSKYQRVIDMYQCRYVDFDIEGMAVAEKPSIDRRSKAMKILQNNNPGLKIALCLPTLPDGLTHDGMYVVNSALKEGVSIDLINGMAMDYGDSAWPPVNPMGDAAIMVGINMRRQFPTLNIGITPMIGVNDVVSEIFNLNDAKNLMDFAFQNSYIKMLSMWSVNRDNSSEGVLRYASPKSSGINQNLFDFMKIWKAFHGASGGTTQPPPQPPVPTQPPLPNPTGTTQPPPQPPNPTQPSPNPTGTTQPPPNPTGNVNTSGSTEIVFDSNNLYSISLNLIKSINVHNNTLYIEKK